MTDTVTTTETNPVVTQASQVPAAQTFSLEYVKELRDEAAKARTDKKQAVEDAATAAAAAWQAKVTEAQSKTSSLEGDLGDAWVEVAKLHAALEANVPTDKVLAFASILKGLDAESIKSSADEAKKLFGIPTTVLATDPTQGSGGGVLPLNGDPILNDLKRMLGA